MRSTLLAVLVAGAVAQPAFAAFYVADDAPKPAQQLAVERSATKASSTVDVEIPFHASTVTLGPRARSLLDRAIAELESADEIVLTNYPGRSSNVSRQRQRVVRAWLIANGIDPAKISLNEAPHARRGNGLTVSMVSLAKQAPLPSPAERFADARLMTAAPTNIPLVQVIAPSPSGVQPKTLYNDQVKIDLAKRIVKMAQTKIIKPEDAVNMLAEILKAQDGQAAQSIVMAQPVAVEMPRSWLLDSTKSLQENIADWAATARWEVPQWSTAAPYRVSYNSTLNGTFVDVIRQVSAVVPTLDFEVNKLNRTLVVNESKNK